ncbi:MAG TPA: hypothetical protein VK815_11005 [Candidatus Acidoferrales bacterium]|jgi:hypothetical protein|nr:hypothetical protein [Candidatus Acidoferrales bacterium]
MCLLYFVILAYIGLSALAFWLLPHWLSIPLIAVMGIVLAIVLWKIMRFFKKVKKALAQFIPQEMLCSLAAAEPFTGRGFAFTFPVPCDVAYTHFHDLEALILKPKFDFPGAPKDALLIASTFPPAELKPKIDNFIEKIFAQVEGRGGEPVPVEVGPLKGERRMFTTNKDGKDVRAESVFLGDEKGSIAWVAIAEGPAFDVLAAKYRELALLIQRVEAAPPAKSLDAPTN